MMQTILIKPLEEWTVHCMLLPDLMQFPLLLISSNTLVYCCVQVTQKVQSEPYL